MADPLQIALVSSTTVSADGASPAVDIGELHTLLHGSVTISSLSGLAPATQFYVVLETSPDGSTGWREALRFAFRSARVEEFTCDELQRFCRLRWESNSATVTLSAQAESHVLYATRRDLRKKSLPDAVTDGEERDVIAEELLSATSDADDALRIQYPGPLASWPESLRIRCCAVARYRIFSRIGFQPQGVDELIVKDYDDALAWLRQVSMRRIVLSGVSAPAMVEPTRVSYSRDNPDPPQRFSDDWGDYG